VSSAKTGNGVCQLRDGNLHTVWQSNGMGPHTVTVCFAKRTIVSRVDLFIDQTIDESYTPSHVALKAGNTEGDLELLCECKFQDPRGWQAVPLNVILVPTANGRKAKNWCNSLLKIGANFRPCADVGGLLFEHKVANALCESLEDAMDDEEVCLARLKSKDDDCDDSDDCDDGGGVLENQLCGKPRPAEDTNENSGHYSMGVEAFCFQLVVLQNHQLGQDCHIRQVRLLGPVDNVC